MNVLFVNPNRMKPPVAPLAADYLCEAMSTHGHAPHVLDLCLETPDREPPTPAGVRDLVPFVPDVVLLTMRNLDDAYFFSRVSFLDSMQGMVRNLRHAFEKPLIVGGCGFSIAPEALLPVLEADFGLAGTAEADLLALLGSIHDPDAFPERPGLVWNEDGRIRSNAPSLPEMEQDYFSPRRFVENRTYARLGGMVGLETKRGCPASCLYCVDPLGKGKRVVSKPIPILLDEIRSLVAQGAAVFHLCDSEFNLPVEHAKAVCTAIREEGLSGSIQWYTYATPSGFDEDLAQMMAAAGCVGINFGVDHCVPEILNALGRKHTEEDLKRTADACRRAGLSFLFDLLLGGPGETFETLREAVEFCRELDVPNVGANVGIRIYPNTRLAAHVLAEGALSDHPSVAGCADRNPELLHPVFYCSHELGESWRTRLEQLIDDDPRFFLAVTERENANYNYNENEVLVGALSKGHRGAFWDILSRVRRGHPPLPLPA